MGPANEAIVVEYIELSERLTRTSYRNQSVKTHLYDKLDELWCEKMNEADRDEAEKRLGAIFSEDA